MTLVDLAVMICLLQTTDLKASGLAQGRMGRRLWIESSSPSHAEPPMRSLFIVLSEIAQCWFLPLPAILLEDIANKIISPTL